MDASTLARATEPFFTTKGIGKGTGLGLSMVQGLAAQSGGRMALRSSPGEGTTVELWLPLAAPGEGEEAAEAGAAPLPPGAAPRVILVVDDDPLVLANTAAMLEDIGHTVLQAASGGEALASLGAGLRVDLLVTDQAMPGMTGTQLAEAVRARMPGLPILLVTGYADLPEGAGERVSRLNKPFTQAALAAAVAVATDGSPALSLSEAQGADGGSPGG